ncbi:YheV family putative zinc ribbon protein [Aliikangiella coralliicola]|uniref:YheV family putative metal-binding protein n=1 Tax=Aliikangiella coralliicola TaxID=2592383 RepID=A0A545UFZ8_9GAMM|nr:YheV family putative zinc ribbon protein [Aliikangiella coralliicola]TQV88397.1 YheV family putative metal-binding protein [Aliikangiella coralliicola]
MKPSQRFIAGAVCPECQSPDSLLLDSNDQSIECVDCGYTQTAEQRDTDSKRESEAQQSRRKSVPEKVNVSDIIRITNIKNTD